LGLLRKVSLPFLSIVAFVSIILFFAFFFFAYTQFIPEEEGIVLIRTTPEYEALSEKYGYDLVSVEAVNLHQREETTFLSQISSGFREEPGCIIVLRAGESEGYVYQLDKEFNIVFRMTLSEFLEAAARVDAGTMEYFYSSLR